MTTPALEARALRVTIGARVLLDDAFFAVGPGECGAIVGKSGSGKSLLMRALCGLHPAGGVIEVGGVRADQAGWEALRARLGVLLTTPGLLDDLSVAENVGYRLSRARVPVNEVRARVADLLDRFGLSAARDKRPSELSGGMQRRAALARALCHRPAVLLLDDPTAGLDPITSAAIVRFILQVAADHGAAVLWTTHDLWRVAAASQHVWMLGHGRLHAVDGGPDAWATELAA